MSRIFPPVVLLVVVLASFVLGAHGKLLSGLFGKGSGCSSASLFQLPRLSLSSLLCPRPYGNLMAGWGSYPSYGGVGGGGYAGGYGGGYGSGYYPSMAGAAYATSSYPSYGSASNSYWNNANSAWSYSPSAWYGSPYSNWRNDQRKSRELQHKTNTIQQQPIQQQIESNSDYNSNSNSNNFASSRYSYGGKLNSLTNKFTTPPSRINTNEIVQQQIMQY